MMGSITQICHKIVAENKIEISNCEQISTSSMNKQ